MNGCQGLFVDSLRLEIRGKPGNERPAIPGSAKREQDGGELKSDEGEIVRHVKLGKLPVKNAVDSKGNLAIPPAGEHARLKPKASKEVDPVARGFVNHVGSLCKFCCLVEAVEVAEVDSKIIF